MIIIITWGECGGCSICVCLGGECVGVSVCLSVRLSPRQYIRRSICFFYVWSHMYIISVCLSVCLSLCRYVRVSVSESVRVSVCVCQCVCVSMCVCVCVCVSVNTTATSPSNVIRTRLGSCVFRIGASVKMLGDYRSRDPCTLDNTACVCVRVCVRACVCVGEGAGSVRYAVFVGVYPCLFCLRPVPAYVPDPYRSRTSLYNALTSRYSRHELCIKSSLIIPAQ